MNRLSLLALIVAGIVSGGCASQNISQYPSSIDATVETDLKAQVAVGEKISGESKMSILFNLITIGDSKFADGVVFGATGSTPIGLPDPISKTKSAAAYNAVTKAGADVIIAPRYVVDVVDYVIFKQVKVRATGYAGKIKSVR